ncbi:carbon storage regulator CsrA [Sedimentisphaera salicampi]|uniref:Translational regulator CsrA n=1 Tax=Sedimentisphaera salicampi TaxID=1941349 RepID=A0A1W6LLU9_9BACT|nr:carbon storage regulator CsrA [Sedimentisphaera salicampi]ARN56780.1 Carbon storage regulator [Sedimentisphaera salicampi]OXU14961.1 Carbon storage regulator [Sedimentisphaera salicampi]
MLVLSRQKDESIVIGDNVVIKVVDVKGGKVKLGVQAPKDVSVHRQEVYDSIHEKDSEKQ